VVQPQEGNWWGGCNSEKICVQRKKRGRCPVEWKESCKDMDNAKSQEKSLSPGRSYGREKKRRSLVRGREDLLPKGKDPRKTTKKTAIQTKAGGERERREEGEREGKRRGPAETRRMVSEGRRSRRGERREMGTKRGEEREGRGGKRGVGRRRREG